MAVNIIQYPPCTAFKYVFEGESLLAQWTATLPLCSLLTHGSKTAFMCVVSIHRKNASLGVSSVCI